MLDKYPTLRQGDTIGIIGGGQLGRMLAMAAARLDFKSIILEPADSCPAAQVANGHIVADYDNHTALKQLAENCQLITYEFENIPASAIDFLEKNASVLPNSNALAKSQDRLIEKKFLADLSIKTAPFWPVGNLAELENAAIDNPADGILKTRRFGYDGKGQAVIRKAFTALQLETLWQQVGPAPCIVEGFINFDREISVIIARNTNGDIACYDAAENIHKHGILHTSTLPANVSAETEKNARQTAEKIVTALEYVGVMGVEFFVEKNGDLMVNEIAPRVHNSGHWTEAACAISQFEQHIRAIANWPLGTPTRHSNCVMENLIGDDISKIPQLLVQPDTVLQLYGKSEARPGRKMGHFTRLV